MEDMNFGQLIFTTLGVAFIIESVTPILLCTLSGWLEFTLRKQSNTYELGSWWVHKYHGIWGADKDHGPVDWFLSLFTTFILLSVPATGYFFTGEAIITVIGISIVLGIIFAPRFVLDIIKSLKYNGRTGESESIEELKAKVKELERKSK
tara:strand:+ start:1002 stop:1451 length:450 start_codon:yes stop_codon:yes gene_type:complete